MTPVQITTLLHHYSSCEPIANYSPAVIVGLEQERDAAKARIAVLEEECRDRAESEQGMGRAMIEYEEEVTALRAQLQAAQRDAEMWRAKCEQR